jgi:hypothetical protein
MYYQQAKKASFLTNLTIQFGYANDKLSGDGHR